LGLELVEHTGQILDTMPVAFLWVT